MTQEAMKEKIEALTNNEEFAAKLKACETAQEIADLYATEGIEFTAEEFEATFDSMYGEDKEFTEDDLDSVAGGIFITGTSFLVGCACIAAAELMGAYWIYKNSKKKKK